MKSKLKLIIKVWKERYLHPDKYLHFLMGFIIAQNTGIITGHYEYGLISGFIAGFGKELWDSRKGGSGFDFFDLWATTVGVIFGTLAYYFL